MRAVCAITEKIGPKPHSNANPLHYSIKTNSHTCKTETSTPSKPCVSTGPNTKSL